MLERLDGMLVIGEAENGTAALALLAQTLWDVVLLDVRMSDLYGMEVAASAREQGHIARILAYSSHADDEYIRGMLASGAVGYVLKEEPPERVVEAILTVARGGRWFSQAILQHMATWASAAPSAINLTATEEWVLRMLTRGLMNQEMADELCLAETTVRFHLRNIYGKLGVKNRSGAAAWAVRNGFDKK